METTVEKDGMDERRSSWVSHIGATIKASRARRFTVEELADRAKVSAGLISQIERGIGNPSFETLLRLSGALELPMAELFSAPPEGSPDDRVVRRDERRTIEVPREGIGMELLVPDVNRQLGVLIMKLPPNLEGSSIRSSHEGEECILVLEGSLVATIGDEKYSLEEGDTITFDAVIPHWWSNLSSKPARILAISTPPSQGRAH
ncbi:helix-turn-helix domain-containing protein [Pseudarthrobacter sp. SSS035]|uniref:helix-turn-helix domain-containing protein n=1 Tax=Pseudarthrobacter sp. SSS035 TaxID=2931399 RepID=UPI00200F6AB5|nr:XRE family transcriptional regulator [Pseudarthrobacter sp. SSS035]